MNQLTILWIKTHRYVLLGCAIWFHDWNPVSVTEISDRRNAICWKWPWKGGMEKHISSFRSLCHITGKAVSFENQRHKGTSALPSADRVPWAFGWSLPYWERALLQTTPCHNYKEKEESLSEPLPAWRRLKTMIELFCYTDLSSLSIAFNPARLILKLKRVWHQHKLRGWHLPSFQASWSTGLNMVFSRYPAHTLVSIICPDAALWICRLQLLVIVLYRLCIRRMLFLSEPLMSVALFGWQQVLRR